ncbi:hypothetical protein Tco_1057805 [Tanacetum coccineum]|uniref:Uncharacterized protein n=1 Tax=Tanacetum coccineum TaxID=301880 RepID=A0ABQ5H6E7_9ASTR
MAKTKTNTAMEEFVTKDRENYYSGITSITVNGKAAYELKGKFLDDLRDNAFSGTNGEDAVEHIKYFLKIVDPIDLPNINYERLRLAVSQSHELETQDDNKEGVTNKGFSDLEEANNDDEYEIAEIFMMETNLFDYETLLEKRYNVTRQVFIEKRYSNNSNTAYPPSAIRLRFFVSDFQHRFIMDDPNITMEEYIRLEEEKARRQGRTFDWQTARYGKMEYYENEDDSFTNLETKYPAIVFDDISDVAFSHEPTVSPLDNNEIDFNISFDEFDDEDYMIVFDENSFSCKIISVDNLKTDSENENDKINIPSSPSPEPTIGYFNDLDFL